MAQALKRSPAYVTRLTEALRRELPGCDVDVERVGAGRYRVGVVWSGFPKTNVIRRQDRVWKVADEVLETDELMNISMILTLRPDEVEVSSNGR